MRLLLNKMAMYDNKVREWNRSKRYTIRRGHDKAFALPRFRFMNEDYYYEFNRRIAFDSRSIPVDAPKTNIVYMFGVRAGLFGNQCSFHFGYQYDKYTDMMIVYAHGAVKGGKSFTKSLLTMRMYDRHEYSLLVVYNKNGYVAEWVIDGNILYSIELKGSYSRLLISESPRHSHFVKELNAGRVVLDIDETDSKLYR